MILEIIYYFCQNVPVVNKYFLLVVVDKEKQLQNEISTREKKVQELTEATAQLSEIKM